MIDEELTTMEIEEKLYPFTLHIPASTWKKIMEYTIACKWEISQFADVTFDPNEKTFTIKNVYLLPQRVSEIGTVMEEEDVSGFLDECIKNGKKELPRCWIHSHVDMDAFFSQIDIDTYEKTLNNKSWVIALVVNKRGEYKAVLQQYAPFPFTWDLKVEIEYPLVDVAKEIYAEISKKVKKEKGMIKTFVDSLFDEKTEKHKDEVESIEYNTLPSERFARTKFIEDHDLYKVQHHTLGWVWTNDKGEIWLDQIN